MNLKRIFHDNGARPEALHQFVFGDKFAGRLDQNFDKLKGASTNRYGRSANAEFAARKINLARARGEDRLNTCRKHIDSRALLSDEIHFRTFQNIPQDSASLPP